MLLARIKEQNASPGSLRVVPRPPPVWIRAPCRVRPGSRAHRLLDLRARSRPRNHPVPADDLPAQSLKLRVSPCSQLSHLRKEFSTVLAVDDVSFEVARGEIFGLLGPNGAGKTTTIRIILNILQPDGGEVLYDGKPFSPRPGTRWAICPRSGACTRKASSSTRCSTWRAPGHTPQPGPRSRAPLVQAARAGLPAGAEGGGVLQRKPAESPVCDRGHARPHDSSFSTSPSPASIPSTRSLQGDIPGAQAEREGRRSSRPTRWIRPRS